MKGIAVNEIQVISAAQERLGRLSGMAAVAGATEACERLSALLARQERQELDWKAETNRIQQSVLRMEWLATVRELQQVLEGSEPLLAAGESRSPSPPEESPVEASAPAPAPAAGSDVAAQNSLPAYGLHRVDDVPEDAHGWRVTMLRRRVLNRRFFSDEIYGGETESLAAARAFRDEVNARHPHLFMQDYVSVAGVFRYCAADTCDLPEEKQQWFWCASWPTGGGRRKRVKFSTSKHGEELAFKLACHARREGMKSLAAKPGAGIDRRANPSAGGRAKTGKEPVMADTATP